jgi:hypothetical protein
VSAAGADPARTGVERCVLSYRYLESFPAAIPAVRRRAGFGDSEPEFIFLEIIIIIYGYYTRAAQGTASKGEE